MSSIIYMSVFEQPWGSSQPANVDIKLMKFCDEWFCLIHVHIAHRRTRSLESEIKISRALLSLKEHLDGMEWRRRVGRWNGVWVLSVTSLGWFLIFFSQRVNANILPKTFSISASGSDNCKSYFDDYTLEWLPRRIRGRKRNKGCIGLTFSTK